jgi:hypothetical protein
LTYFGATATGLSIKHDSSHAVFNTKTGNHLFQGNGSTQLTINQSGGRLQYDNADKLT